MVKPFMFGSRCNKYVFLPLGGGVGQYLADWICEGEAPYELLEFDPLRYGAWTSMDYAVAKTRQGARVDMSRYI